MNRALAAAAVLIALAAGSAAGDAKQAKALNVKGLKLLKAKKYEEAQETFVKAVAADPTMALAHYNLASAAALNSDLEVVLEQVRWLKQSADPVAVARLIKIKTDQDFAGIAPYPAFRESVGLPKREGMTAELLLEYGGVWHGVDMGFGNTWHTYTLLANGTYKEHSYYGEQGDTVKRSGKWRIVGDGLVLDKSEPFTWVQCGSRDGGWAPENDGSMCLADEQNEYK